MALGMFCIHWDAVAVNLALPHIGHDLGASDGGLQWVVSVYLLAAGALMWGAGALGDVFGRRRVAALGLALFALASLAGALAPSLGALIVARILQGASGALFVPTGLALLTHTYSGRSPGRAIGWVLGVGGLATACGPPVGGLVTEVLSWRAVFWSMLPLTAAAWLLLGSVEHPGVPAIRTRLDVRRLVVVTAAVGTAALLVDRGPVWGWRSGASLALLALVAALLVVLVCGRTDRPTTDAVLTRNRRYLALTAAGAVANVAAVTYLLVVPVSLQAQWGLAVDAAGLMFLAPAVLMAVAGPVAGRLRPGRAVVAMVGCLGIDALLLCALPMLQTRSSYLLVVTLCGASLGLGNALTLTMTQAAVHPDHAGAAAGLTKAVITTAAGLGVSLSGPVARLSDHPAQARAAATALTVVGVGCLVTGVALGVGRAIVDVHRQNRRDAGGRGTVAGPR